MTKPVKRAWNKPRKPLDNWIRPELKRLYGKAYSKEGVDLNGDGKLQANEKIATHNNNNIPGYKKNQKNPYKKIIGDWTDWLSFYRANYKLITAKAGKNKKASSIGLRNSNRQTAFISSLQFPCLREGRECTY